jgi:hypothetical protein
VVDRAYWKNDRLCRAQVCTELARHPEKIREKLKPGMAADVLIATGERTVLAYLTQPMTDAIRRGMRED